MITIRPALPVDARRIFDLTANYTDDHTLIAKDLIAYFEDIQEFLVAEDSESGEVVGCGALHVFWDDIAEVRTLAVRREVARRGIGGQILVALLARARSFGLKRVFCLTFETRFFAKYGFTEINGTPVGMDVYQEILRSHDMGTAEFLDLARAKPNTLGNTRMLIELK